jgi:hypothetical protein
MSETKDGDKHYIDMTTLRKTGSSVKVWELNNFPNRKEYAKIQGVFSVRYRAEYDCINEKTRYLTISAHSELDAQGEMLGQDTREGNWIPIPPSTIGWNRLQSFCK